MKIIDAKPDHVEFISQHLVDYFAEANTVFGYPKFFTEYDLMHKNVLKRINKPEKGYTYFVAVDEEDTPIGFVNVMINEQRVGSFLIVIGNDKNIKRELVTHGTEFLRNNKVVGIQGEFFAHEEDTSEVYKELGVNVVWVRFSMDN